MAIVLRSSKSVPLTHTEMDGNFTDLNTRTNLLEENYVKTVNSLTVNSSNSITLNTDDISESGGATNIWFTNTRARTAISITDSGGDGSLSYNSSTGVITYTGPSASEVRAHFTAGSGINITSGEISVPTDGINDTHIDFGTGANQVNTANLPEDPSATVSSGTMYYTDSRVLTKINSTSIDALSDVDTTSVTPNNNDVLTWSSSDNEWIPAIAPGAAGGEANTVTNVGAGVGLYKTKVASDLKFKTLIFNPAAFSVTENTDDISISMQGAPDFGNIEIGGDTISNLVTNNDINLVPNGTGVVAVSGELTATTVTATNLSGTLTTAAQTNITSLGTIASNLTLDNTVDLVFTGSSNTTTMVIADPSTNRIITLPNATGTVITTGNLTGIVSTGALDSGSITSNFGNINIGTSSLTAGSLYIDSITINQNDITTNVSNADLVLSPNGTGNVSVSDSKIINLATPTSAQDAATKAYVDSQVSAGTAFDIAGNTGTDTVTVGTDTLTFEGTASEIETAVTNNKVTIGLPDSVTINTLEVSGNLSVLGTTTTVSTTDLDVADSLIRLAVGNESSDLLDIGFTGHYYNGSRTAHAGLFRDASDSGIFKLFSDYGPEPTGTTIDINDANFTLATLQLGTLDADTITTDGLNLYDNVVETTRSNDNLEIRTSGTGKVVVAADIISSSDSTYNLGASGNEWATVYTDSVIASQLTGTLQTASQANITSVGTLSSLTVSGTVDANAVTTDGIIVVDNNIATTRSNDDLILDPAGTGKVRVLGNVVATLFEGTSTSAQYADLAEMYIPDAGYPVGTVLKVGGAFEVTHCDRLGVPAGVVSENPAYLMNSEQEGGIPVALVGRVKVRIMGPVEKAQVVKADNNGLASATADGLRVGIALETNTNPGEKLVECMLKV